MKESKEFIDLPREIYDQILKKHPEFGYTLGWEERQLNWVHFDFDEFVLVVTLNCDEEKHSLKFIVSYKQ